MTNKLAKDTKNHAIGRLKISLTVILATLVIYLFVALFTFNINDPGWTTASSEITIKNYAGPVGALIASTILSLVGIFGFIIPLLILDAIRATLTSVQGKKINYSMVMVKAVGLIMLIIGFAGLAELYFSIVNPWMPQRSGGIIGYESRKFFVTYLNHFGGSLGLLVTLIIGIILYSGSSWFNLCKSIFAYIAKLFDRPNKVEKTTEKKDDFLFDDFENFNKKTTKPLSKANDEISIPLDESKAPIVEPKSDEELFFGSDDIQIKEDNDIFFDELPAQKKTPEPKLKPQIVEEKPKEKIKPPSLNKAPVKPVQNSNKAIPSLDLLIEPEVREVSVSKHELDETSAILEQTLNDFNIKAKVVGAYPGPVITRFEIDLARGTKVSKLTGISQDLARALSTTAVRVVEVIPGKPYVGLELPNPNRQMVRIKEVLTDPQFTSAKAPTTMGLGVDIGGKPTFAELSKMPHLLVAGTTGSGKSVGVNAMIISMLYKATPDELKFIMIDPKMLELSIYEGIPHLLTPVVTDMTEAANSLRWCVKEMERRYALMSAAGVRNIALLNEKIEQAEKAGKPLKDTAFIKFNPERAHEAPLLTKMPYIVVIADEFADMIMVVGKKVEELITRLAQKARAAGIHIILATQRPSVNVVTGLIKANIPTRISFQVSSRIDSKTILDQNGGEDLLGNGDMLYLKPGLGAPMRVHGPFVDDEEVHRVVEAWKEYGEPDYVEEITNSGDEDGEGSNGEGGSSEDPLYNEAVEIVIKTQKASISAVQRKLKIGYNRSARLMEEMEENGIVSEMNSNGMREVLIKREQ